jgi:IS4 transposase
MKARYREQNAAEKSNFFWFKFFPFRNQGAMNSGTISIFFRTQLFFLWLYINAALFFLQYEKALCSGLLSPPRINPNCDAWKRDAKECDAKET